MDAIQESLNQMMHIFGQRMDAFEERQASKSEINTEIADENLALEFSNFKSFVVASLRALQSQIEVMAKQIDQQEMRGRRKILLLHGIHEDPKEDISKAIVKLMVDKLKVLDFSAAHIRRCHRMGRSISADKPRPILLKLCDEVMRNRIWTSKTCLKGTGITLSEFLTKTRHELFLMARKEFGVAKCWTRDGVVFVIGADGTRHRVSCTGDLATVSPKPSKLPPTIAGPTSLPPVPKQASLKSRRAASVKK